MENVNDKDDRKGLAINFDVQGYRYQKCNEVQDGYEVTNDTVLILDADSIENVSFKPYDIESVGHTEKDDVNYYFSNDRKSKDKKDFEKIFYSYKRAFNSRPIKTRNKSFMKAMEKYGIEEDQIDSFIKEAQRMGSALDSATSAMAQKASGEKFNYKDKEFQILCDTIKGMQRDNSQIKENENGEYGTSSASTISMCLWLTGYIDSINGEQISAQELLQKIATYAK